MAKLDAINYLAQPDKHPPRPVCVAFGDDLFLRRQVLLGLRQAVLGGDEGDISLTSFEGPTAEFRDVVEELTTMAMFGGRRLVVVEDDDEGPKSRARTAVPAEDKPKDAADEPAEQGSGFISRYRPQLEDYVARPGRSGVLVLDVKSWPSNTRLYKAVDAHGLAVDCNTPKPAALGSWLKTWAKQAHQAQLAPGAGELLVEMIGSELGLLDQELAKLALMAGNDKKITPEMIQKMGGGWRAKTTWVMLDLALEGNATEALRQIDRLLAGGEAPIGLLAQVSASLRRLAAATRMILQAEAAGRHINIGAALQQAGVKPFVLQKTEGQLRRLTRQRGKQLYRWLLEADLDLKGDSQVPPRLILERLIVRLAAPA
jgi:DNA polymerase-3 subunit delta